MSNLTCPYCYGQFLSTQLLFQCIGRPAPGRSPCMPQVDTVRREHTGYNLASLPVFAPTRTPIVGRRIVPCVYCAYPTGVRACPRCHTPLPPNFAESISPLISFFGAAGTGKTVYLSVLAHELLRTIGVRFGAATSIVDGGATIAQSEIFEKHGLVPATRESTIERRLPLIVEWRSGRTQRSTFLSLFDTAGDEDMEVLDYFAHADALVLLLDPFMIPQARDMLSLPEAAVKSKQAAVQVVTNAITMLRRRHGYAGKIPAPVAVAIPKIDAFFHMLGPDHPLLRAPMPSNAYDEQTGANTHAHAQALLHSWGAANIDIQLSTNFRTFRYFVVSSLGAEPDYHADYDQNPVDVRGVRPFRVDEPLLWLMSLPIIGTVPRAARRR